MAKNFLLFSWEYPPYKGGVATYYKNMVEHWPEENMYVLAPRTDSSSTANEDARVIRRKLTTSKILPRWLPGFWHLFRIVTKKNIDRVIVGQILPLGTITYYLSKVLNIKYAVFLHGMDLNFAFKTRRKRYLALKILGSAEKIICSNSYVAQLAREKLQQDSPDIHVVNPGISEDSSRLVDEKEQQKLREKLKIEDKFVMLTVGRLVERKGVDKAIDAFSHIKKDIPNLVYVVAGTGPELSFLQQKKKEVDDEERIIFVGDISEREKWNLLAGCDILVMPSREINGDFEGFGIVYLEANLTGTPVIAGNKGGVPDAVIHERNGLVVDPEDPTQIGKAIKRMYRELESRRKWGQKGRERALRDFNWPGQAEKIYKLLNKNI